MIKITLVLYKITNFTKPPYILSKKETIHFFNYNLILIRTKMFNSIRIYYSPPLLALDYA